ncbi:MAG: hypothetical protein NT050_03000, partial [Verrucomicrobia bacterium]|nr:hypothetical protein [Verrucomicrobiota bacterium]
PAKGFTKLIRHAAEPQMLQSTGNPADSSAYPNTDESALSARATVSRADSTPEADSGLLPLFCVHR